MSNIAFRQVARKWFEDYFRRQWFPVDMIQTASLVFSRALDIDVDTQWTMGASIEFSKSLLLSIEPDAIFGSLWTKQFDAPSGIWAKQTDAPSGSWSIVVEDSGLWTKKDS